jgi:hypothetical protein
MLYHLYIIKQKLKQLAAYSLLLAVIAESTHVMTRRYQHAELDSFTRLTEAAFTV